MVSQARLFAAFALVAIATAVSVDHHVVELGTTVPVISCPAGSLYTANAAGLSATCTACAAGKFIAAGSAANEVCTDCAAGTSSAAGAACLNCAAGTYATAGKACAPCAAGNFAAAACCVTLDKGGKKINGVFTNRAARSRTDATPCSHLCNECRFYRKGNVPSQLCVNWIKRNENNPAPKPQWTAKTADDAKCGK